MLQKNRKWLFSLVYALTPFTALAASQGARPVDSQLLFIPKGFDDNDRVEVVVDGYLPGTCWKQTDPVVKVHPDSRAIDVQAMAIEYDAHPPCQSMRVPFTEVATVGILPDGTHTVSVPGLPTQTLPVATSPSAGPDDFIYAVVDSLNVEVIPEQKRIIGHLHGRFTNSCMTWQETKVTDSKDTIQVQPIVMTLEGDTCENREIAYATKDFDIAWRKPGRYLLHVRSMEGRSRNLVFEVYGE